MKMSNIIYVKTYEPPQIDRKEILRYAGVKREVPELEPMLEPELELVLKGCLDELRGRLVYKVCYREFPVVYRDNCLDLGFAQTESQALKRNLAGCDRLILFAATIGIEIDRLIAKYGALSPVKALLLQAIGAERIECLCDVFCQEIAEQAAVKGGAIRPRFSPGYGDFPLEVQKDIFRVLDCPRKIGLSLNESLLMSPSKSVTALIGMTNEKCTDREGAACESCAKEDCEYRSIS